MNNNEKKPPVVNKGILVRLIRYMKKYKLRLAIVFFCIIFSAAAGVMASIFLEKLIDVYIADLLVQDVPDFAPLIKALVMLAIFYVFGIAATLTYNLVMVSIAQGVLKNIRSEMFSHMQTLPISYFDTHSHGSVMSYYTNDTDTLERMIAQTIPAALTSFVTFISVFVAMLSISIWLTLFVIAVLIIMLIITKKIGGNSRKYFIRQQQSVATVNGYIEEMINGQRVIKVFCHEPQTKAAFDEHNAELARNSSKANGNANLLMPILGNMGYMLYVLLAVVGGALAINGIMNVSLKGIDVLSIGAIVSFLTLSRSFVAPIGQMSQQINTIAMAMAGAGRIFSLIDEEPEADNGYVTLVNAKRDENGNIVETDEHTGMWAWRHPHEDGSITYAELKGEVRMYDVDFGYVDDKLVLQNITLYAEPGQKVAFVGATGAGKTTITNLINRFYYIDDGKIRYDGININKIKKADLRRSLGVVLQDVNLFTGTVMENLRYGRPDATDEECIAAAKLANADGFIRMLPQGYETVLSGDGSGLSQGQRQLISIARAAVADPPVMILDEATSSIDTRTEAIVQRGMDSLMKGRTVFVIAHRLSTVQNSDVIMVLDHGRIIERGSHDQLIEQKGNYYQLYTGVFELE